MALRAISLVTIPVTDQDRAKAFYVDTMGFTVAADYQMGADEAGSAGTGARWLMLSSPEGGADLLLSTWSTTPGTARLAVDCDDAENTRRELVGRGLEPIDAVQDADFGRWFGVEDPDGNQLLVVEPR